MSLDQINVSHTARQHLGLMRMGRTSGQRSAELIAAFHALLTPSEETHALSRPMGRFLANRIMQISGNYHRPTLNMIPNRRNTISHLVSDYLMTDPHSRVVEVAAGLTTRGVLLGSAFPETIFTEIDLPDVLATKRSRLANHLITPPPNLHWIEADLVETPLVVALAGSTADLIVAEGLLLYFPPEEIIAIVQSLLAALKPGGVLIVDIFNRTVIQELQQASNSKIAYKLFTGVTGKFQGMVDAPDDARTWLETAGGTDIELHQLSDAAERYDLLQPVRDIAFIAVCRKPMLSHVAG